MIKHHEKTLILINYDKMHNSLSFNATTKGRDTSLKGQIHLVVKEFDRKISPCSSLKGGSNLSTNTNSTDLYEKKLTILPNAVALKNGNEMYAEQEAEPFLGAENSIILPVCLSSLNAVQVTFVTTTGG